MQLPGRAATVATAKLVTQMVGSKCISVYIYVIYKYEMYVMPAFMALPLATPTALPAIAALGGN